MMSEATEGVQGVLAESISGRDYQTYLTTRGPSGWLEGALHQIRSWLADRTLQLDLNPFESGFAQNPEGTITAEVLHHTRARERGVRVRVTNSNQGKRFTTTILLASDHDGTGWMLVQATCSDRKRISSTPNVVQRLLDVVEFEDGAPLLNAARPLAIDAMRDLEDLLSNPDRRLPVLLAVPMEGVPLERWCGQVHLWVSRCAGLAHVAVLDPRAAQEFEVTHPRLAPREGTLRTYPPGLIPDSSSADRCRWISAATLAGEDSRAKRVVEGVVRKWQTAQAALPRDVRVWDSAFERAANKRLRESSAPRRGPLAEQILARRAAAPAPTELLPAEQSEARLKDLERDLRDWLKRAERFAEEQPQADPAAVIAERDQLRAGNGELSDKIGELETLYRESMQRAQDLQETVAHVQTVTTIEDLRGPELLELVELATRETADPAEVERLHARIDALTDDRDQAAELLTDASIRLAEAEAELHTSERNLDSERSKSAWLATQAELLKPGLSYQYTEGSGVPLNPLGEQPDAWEALMERLVALDEWGLVFTGQVGTMKGYTARDADGSALRATWAALGTLASYVKACSAGWEGSVSAFCENPPPGSFAVKPNQHAHDESKSTRQDKRCAKAREFPVPTDVSTDGLVAMWAHFKIHTFSPESRVRLHYYDQTSGATRRIYIGYIGQHLPSGSTTKVRR